MNAPSEPSAADVVRVAAGAMKTAVRRMFKEYPLFAGLLERCVFSEDAEVQTMAVTIRGGSVWLLHAPEFVLSCTADQLMGALHHEVHHILFEHLLLDPGLYPDQEALIIATEVTANEWVKEPLPGNPILLENYPGLPANEDTDKRYRRLARRKPKAPTGSGSNPEQQSVPPGQNSGDAAQNSGDAAQKSGDVAQNSEERGQHSGATGQDSGDSSSPQTLDDHTVWSEARSQPTVSAAVLRTIVHQAAAGLSAEQWESLPDLLKRAVVDACDRGRRKRGSDAGNSIERLQQPGTEETLDWRRLLSAYVSQILKRAPSFSRPPRRFPGLLGMVPGTTYRPDRPVVMAAVDTSGSLTDDMLSQISTELLKMSRSVRVMVVECDVMIHAVYELRGRIEEVHGRGGTDLRPPFEPEILRQVKPDLVVYFTDGEGPAPYEPPRVPVIWCLTSEGVMPAAWGREIRMTSC